MITSIEIVLRAKHVRWINSVFSFFFSLSRSISHVLSLSLFLSSQSIIRSNFEWQFPCSKLLHRPSVMNINNIEAVFCQYYGSDRNHSIENVVFASLRIAWIVACPTQFEYCKYEKFDIQFSFCINNIFVSSSNRIRLPSVQNKRNASQTKCVQ